MTKACSTIAPACRNALQKFTLLRPSVVKSSTRRVRAFSRTSPSICALRQAGAIVEHAFVIFHYGIFPQSEQLMKDIGVELHALATWWDVLKIAKSEARFDAATMREVEKFLNDPVSWSAAHGGVSELPSA